MFIAMNRFRVAKGSEAAFEQVWMSRDSHLEEVPGFVEFHLLKGPEAEDHTLYASHTVWKNRAVGTELAHDGDAWKEAMRTMRQTDGVLMPGDKWRLTVRRDGRIVFRVEIKTTAWLGRPSSL